MERDQDEEGTAGTYFTSAKSNLFSRASKLDGVREKSKGAEANIGRTPSTN